MSESFLKIVSLHLVSSLHNVYLSHIHNLHIICEGFILVIIFALKPTVLYINYKLC